MPDLRGQAIALLRAAANGEAVALPFLTRAELAALQLLGRNQLLDEAEIRWWEALPEDVRLHLGGAVLRGLMARGLVRLRGAWPDRPPPGSIVPVEPSPGLALVLAVRMVPAFVVECLAEGAPIRRLWGPAGTPDPRCVLAEDLEGEGVHRFGLSSLDGGIDRIASWACAGPSKGADATEVRIVDVGWPGETARPPQRWVLAASAGAVVGRREGSGGGAGEARPLTAPAMRTQLKLLLRS